MNDHPVKHTLFISALLLVCLLAYTACSVKKTPDYSSGCENTHTNMPAGLSAAEKARALLPEKLIKIGFVQVGHESDWRIAATKSCQEVFSEENGYELFFVDADNDPQVQTDAVRKFIQERMDYILIDPILTTGWTAVLKEAYHAQIPVILLDRTIDCSKRYYTAWFGSDFVREGEYAGQWLQSYLNRQGRGCDPIHIVTINGTEGASAQLGRTEGFRRYLNRHSEWKLLAEECGDFTESGGRMVMEQYLKRYKSIDVVICQNDNEALGACAAMDEAGISYGKDGDVILISFDASRAGLEAVMEGKINADFECNPLSPPYAAAAIQQLEAGIRLKEQDNYLPEECFTSDERPMILKSEDETKQMRNVTRELLKNRAY